MRGQQEMDFSTEGSVIMDYGPGAIWPEENVKFVSYKLFTSQDVNWWTGVVWIIVMFLSAVWTLILTAPIHCRLKDPLVSKWCNDNFL